MKVPTMGDEYGGRQADGQKDRQGGVQGSKDRVWCMVKWCVYKAVVG